METGKQGGQHGMLERFNSPSQGIEVEMRKREPLIMLDQRATG
jgi:hypothetical protein